MDASDKASDDDIEGLEGELGAKKALTWAEPSGNGFVGWIVDDDTSLGVNLKSYFCRMVWPLEPRSCLYLSATSG